MPPQRLRIVFFGSPEFAVPALAAVAGRHDVVLAVSQPDKPAGRGKQLTAPPVKQRAIALGIPTDQPTTLKGGDFVARMQVLEPDAFVVVAYGRILPQALLDVPRLGPWNVHASLLPRYRGAGPIQWAVINGETETGVCIMRMEAGLDTGPVAACAVEPIRDDDTAGTLAGRLSTLGAKLLLETLPGIAEGRVTLTPQDHPRATLAPMLKKEDGLLSFAEPARAVSARARGVDPWPGATAVLAGESVKLFAPRIVAGSGLPGEVLGMSPEGLVVACARDAVAFGELQLPGRKRLPAAAVVAGRPIAPGTVLGGRNTSRTIEE